MSISALTSSPFASRVAGNQLSSGSQTAATPDTSGLVFSSNGAKYNGQTIALSDIIDDNSGKFTDAQRKQADDVLNAREQKAFFYLYPSGNFSGTDAQKDAQLARFFSAYASYLQNLPPEEQNSQRYRGQLPQAEALAQQFSGASIGGNTSEATKVASPSENPILKLLQPLDEKAKKSRVVAATDARSGSVTITISAQAQQLLANPSASPASSIPAST